MGCSCTKPLVREEDVDSPAAAAAGPPRRHSGVQGKATPAPAPAPVPAAYRRESGSWRKVSGKFESPIVSAGDPARSKSGQLVLGGPIAIHRKEVLSTLPKHIEAEQAAAGWPAWLVAVAGEAIKGWIPRRADSFEKLDKIGQGTYSNVYKARDLDTGKIVALKKVRFDNREPESVRFMAREIQVLRRLHHPNIIKLEGLVTSRMACSLYLVFEYMEHDLAGLVACPGITFSESQVKCYMQQLLRGLDHCHSRGVLHRDIKGSNLLIDNDGTLKIADFGLATFFNPDEKQQLTSRVVTLWYRPPELLLGATEYGVAVDLWSTGCILAELLASKPIMPGRTEVEQLHKIFKLCGSPSEDYWKRSKLPHATIFKPQQPYKRCLAETFKDFPTSALALLETLLSIEPVDRGTSAIALKTDFFNTKPLPCDPSILPKYPPSKELDAKLRDEEARRQRAAGGRARNVDMAKKLASREQSGKAVPVPDANAELATSLQKRRVMNGAAKCKSEKFNVHLEDSEVGFSINPPRLAEGSVKAAQKDDAIVVPWYPPQATRLSVAPLPPPHLLGLAKQDAIQNKETCETKHREKSHRIVSHSGYTDETVKPAIPDDIPMRNSDDFKDQDLSPHYNAGLSGFGNQSGRVHFSGPLLPNTANIEEILGEHERQIQKAVRRARYDKVKGQRNPGTYKARSSNRSGEVPIFGSTYNNLRSSSDRWKDSKPLSTTDGGPESGLASVIENDEKEQET